MPREKQQRFYCVVCGKEVAFGRQTCGGTPDGENGPCLKKVMAKKGTHKAKDPTPDEIELDKLLLRSQHLARMADDRSAVL